MKKRTLLCVIIGLLLLGFVSSTIAWAATDVHSVIAQKPIVLVDGLTNTTFRDITGTVSMNWKDKTRYGFFNAKIAVMNTFAPLEYELQLIAVGNASPIELEGLFDIKKNGVLIASGIVGKLYGIDQPVGQYFKFYGGDSQNNTNKWHLAAYITYRCDY